jgi:hypothetical protein
MSQVIGVEIARTCNLRCPNCSLQERLFLPKSQRKEDPNLEKKLVKYLPENSILLFVGMGEPTLPPAQESIIRILKEREDCKGFIQSNGTQVLLPEIMELVDENRLEIGVSYDSHHSLGGRKGIEIQNEYVRAGISMAIQESDTLGQLRPFEAFPHTDYLLLDPFLEGDTPHTSWQTMERALRYFADRHPEKIVFSQIPSLFQINAPKYWSQAVQSFNEAQDLDGMWRKHEEGYSLIIRDVGPGKEIRVLTSGDVLTDLAYVSEPWEKIEMLRGSPYLIPIEEFEF